MNRTFLFPVVILCLLISGCSPKSINSNQNFQQTCNVNPINNNESQEKQCCLKDSLETRIKHIEEICILKEYNLSKDSICNISSSSSYSAASSSITAIPTRNTKIHGQFDYKSKEVADMRQGCFGANCQVNTIQITKNKKNNHDCSFTKKVLDIILNGYTESIVITIIISLLGGIFLLIPAAIKKYFFLLMNFFKKSTKTKKYNILSPTENANISKRTLDQLKFAILKKNDSIKNIAITGNYGSGKSSAWLTFCKKYNVKKIKKIANISLAKFCNRDKKDDNLTKDEETKIEIAIIQQLIYSKKNTDLKYSHYPKINNLTDLQTTIPSSFLFILLGLILPLENNTIYCIIEYFLNKQNPLGTVYLTFIFSFIYIVLFFIIQSFNKIRIAKICFKECEITLGNSESVFAKYLNEIVYFFEATKCDCVVIEDLERFGSIELFTKLREINDLINNYPAIKKTVKFVYLIKDDILPKYQRTKFFDFIIPIIPVISPYNSAGIVEDNIKELNANLCLKESDDDPFLSDLQKYLKDYRLVKNCINESIIYKDEMKLFDLELYLHNDFNTKLSLSDKKFFALILYKNLFPKDFSKLQKREGVLYDCLNNFHYTPNSTVFDNIKNDSIKNLLNSPMVSDVKKELLAFVHKLNNKYEYKKEEVVEFDLLVLLLTKGYIDNDYESYIVKSNESIFTKDEKIYLFNIKNDIPNSQNLLLEHFQLIKNQIIDYQWKSPGVLNNDMIDYILQKNGTNFNTTSNPSFTIATNIAEAMYSYDKLKSHKKDYFIPQYFAHSIKNHIDITLLLRAIANFIVTPIYSSKTNDILMHFFEENNTIIFSQFLHTNILRPLKIHMGSDISNFLDLNESIKNKVFDYNINNDNFIDDFEKNNIQINLTNNIYDLLNKKELLSFCIYKLTLQNLDLILLCNNLGTTTSKYITRCLTINGLKERFKKSIYDFKKNILSKINEIDEEYETLEFIFSEPKLTNEDKIDIFDHTKKSWNLYSLYCYYVLIDDNLIKSITNSLINEDIEMTFSDSLLNDEKIIKKFIRSIIKHPKFDSEILSHKFLPFCKRFISILNCYEGDNFEINRLNSDRNNILQKITIESDEFENDCINNSVMINLMIMDPVFFEEQCPEKKYSKEDSFQLAVLDAKSDKLENIQKRFFKKISKCPTPDENPNRFTIYKNLGLHFNNFYNGDGTTLLNIAEKTQHHINNIKDFDLFMFDQQIMGKAIDFSDELDSIIPPLDLWSKLLWKTLKSWYNDLCSFVTYNTFPYGNEMQGLKGNIRTNSNKTNEMNKKFKQYIHNIEFWINEINEYLSNSEKSR